jgi:DNA-binding winged helix-turn-helix (wHTH) protein
MEVCRSRLLDEGPDPERSRLRFGACELDAATRSLARHGEPVPVQARVFDLLVFLIERHDRVVSSDELLDTLWGGVAVTPSSLSRAIYKARLAVGDDGEKQGVIATVRGRGFRFVAPVRSQALAAFGSEASDLIGRGFELDRLEATLRRTAAKIAALRSEPASEGRLRYPFVHALLREALTVGPRSDDEDRHRSAPPPRPTLPSVSAR